MAKKTIKAQTQTVPATVSPAPAPAVGPSLHAQVRTFVERFVVFPTPGQSDLVALWLMGSYLADLAPAWPYAAITARTSGAGKSTTLKVIAELAPVKMAVSVGSSISFYLAKIGAVALDDLAPMRTDGTKAWNLPLPVLCIDESEGGGANQAMQQFFRSGYKAGDIVGKVSTKNEAIERPSYCPKAFALIGTLPRLLRDRSILFELERVAAPPEDFLPWEVAADADAIRSQLMLWRRRILAERFAGARVRLYAPDARMQARAREIYAPVLAVAAMLVLDAATMDRIFRAIELSEAAKDAAGDRVIRVDHDAEKRAADALKSVKLLQDVARVSGELPAMSTMGIIERLRGVQLGGYQTLTPDELSRLLGRFGVSRTTLRVQDRPKVTEKEPTARNGKGEAVKFREVSRWPLAKGYDTAAIRKLAEHVRAVGVEAYLAERQATAVVEQVEE